MAFPKNIIDPRNPVGYEEAIVALATFPDLEQAKAFLAQQKITATVKGLETLKVKKAAEIAECRKEIAPKLEAELTGDMLDEARYATRVIDMAIRRTEERLAKNMVADPARVARDLSQLRTQAVDKRLALEGRPTAIVEKRSPEEILARLEAMGVARRVDVETTADEP